MELSWVEFLAHGPNRHYLAFVKNRCAVYERVGWVVARERHLARPARSSEVPVVTANRALESVRRRRHPLATAIGQAGQAEWQLARHLLASLPQRALLLADRRHGCAAFGDRALAPGRKVGSHFLFRARTHIKVQVLKRFRDGSHRAECGKSGRSVSTKTVAWRSIPKELR